MKVMTQVVLYLLGTILIILAVDFYVEFLEDTRLLEEDNKRNAEVLGNSLRLSVEKTWLQAGEIEAMKVIEAANSGQRIVGIRWVWFDAAKDDPASPLQQGKIQRPAGNPREIVSLRQGNHVYTYVPVTIGMNRSGGLELSESLSAIHSRQASALWRQIALFCATAIVCFFIISFVGQRLVGKPLKALSEKTKRISKGDLGGPMKLSGKNEFNELAESLNTMCDDLATARQRLYDETAKRIEVIEQLRHADRLNSVGRLAAGVAHELGTPLNVVSARASLIERGEMSLGETAESAKIIKEQTQRMTDIIRGVLDFSRKRSTAKVLIDAQMLANATVKLLSSSARNKKISIRLVGREAPAMVTANNKQMQQVLINLIDNAIQSIGAGGEIEIGLNMEHKRRPAGSLGRDGEFVCMYVRDTGSGISPDDLSHVFDPFFTTKDIGAGTGLGLSIAHGIVVDHGGWINVETEPGKGSCFSIYLPRAVES